MECLGSVDEILKNIEKLLKSFDQISPTFFRIFTLTPPLTLNCQALPEFWQIALFPVFQHQVTENNDENNIFDLYRNLRL